MVDSRMTEKSSKGWNYSVYDDKRHRGTVEDFEGRAVLVTCGVGPGLIMTLSNSRTPTIS